MARGTVGTMIDRVQQQLDSAIRHEVNWLGASLDASETTVTLLDEPTSSVRPGAILSVGRELMRVRSVNVSAQEAVVMRGWRSDAEIHAADAELLISPRFTRFDLYQAMVHEIESWGQRLFKITSYEWTVADDVETIELPASMADAIGVVELRRQNSDDTDNTAWPTLNFRLMRGEVGVWSNASTSGLVIRMLPFGRSRMPAASVHALIAVPFDVTTADLTEDEDLVADYGLEPSMLEVVELGIRMRVMSDAENARSGRAGQDEPRRAEEVPAGSALTVGQTLRGVHARRLNDEVLRLQRKWKVRSW
jgi:hypothetical protein